MIRSRFVLSWLVRSWFVLELSTKNDSYPQENSKPVDNSLDFMG